MVFQICSNKSFKTRPNSPYGGKTSVYFLLQQGVYADCRYLPPLEPLLPKVIMMVVLVLVTEKAVYLMLYLLLSSCSILVQTILDSRYVL